MEAVMSSREVDRNCSSGIMGVVDGGVKSFWTLAMGVGDDAVEANRVLEPPLNEDDDQG